MHASQQTPLGTLLMTFIFALLLAILPVPGWMQGYHAPWPGIALIYWCLTSPQRIGVFSGWSLGVVEDSLTGTMLGQHALAHSLTAFICLQMYRRIRVFPIWQQTVAVFGLLLLEQIVYFWIISSAGHMPSTLLYWTPALIGTLIWPVLVVLVSDMRKIFHLS
jgi:rod shape-determining protein MreD